MSRVVKGFEIMCRSCGVKMIIQPGNRDHEKEPIGFGMEQVFETDWIGCQCGNAIESDYDANKEIWRDVSKRPADEARAKIAKARYSADRLVDESAAYGIDCVSGRCDV